MGLLLVVCGLGACAETAEPPPKTAHLGADPLLAAEQHKTQQEADAVVARERAWANGPSNEGPGDPWSSRTTAPAAKSVAKTPADAPKSAAFAQQCAVESERRQTRLAALEPKVLALRAGREEAARTRPEDEAWVRANCHWENDPRYALELQRRASLGEEARYEVDDRFRGFSHSVPKCPKATSARRMQIAAEIANGLVDPRMAGVLTKIAREQEDKAVGVAEYDALKATLAACGAQPEQSTATAPSQEQSPEGVLGF